MWILFCFEESGPSKETYRYSQELMAHSTLLALASHAPFHTLFTFHYTDTSEWKRKRRPITFEDWLVPFFYHPTEHKEPLERTRPVSLGQLYPSFCCWWSAESIEAAEGTPPGQMSRDRQRHNIEARYAWVVKPVERREGKQQLQVYTEPRR